MTLANMKLRVAENVGILAADGTTINEGMVTADGIINRLNDVYREEIFPVFSDKFPDDFTQTTYPLATYTSTGTCDAATTGTTLVATTAIFDNSMEGFEVQNATTLEKVKIVTYSSGTTVTVDDTLVTADWIGATIYVLGNEYTFSGDVADIKEILQVSIKYASSDTFFKVAHQGDYKDLIRSGNEKFQTKGPYFYRTMIDIATIPTPAVGILPYPTSYTGQIQFKYIERPPVLGTSDEPSITIPGISEVLIYGTTAWAFRLQRKWDDAQYYQGLYEQYKRNLIGSYKPRSRAGVTTVKQSGWMNNMKTRMM
jgi:hypothetical protein